jgi:Flp pilus assembly protein TadD
MAVGLRVRVNWDETTVEDRVFSGWDELRIGRGPAAAVPTSGGLGCYVVLRRQGAAIAVEVEPGSAAWLQRPGDEARQLVDGRTALELKPPFRQVTFGFGGGDTPETIVEVEHIGKATAGSDRDPLLAAVAVVAILFGMLGGAGWHLAKRLGDGTEQRWGKPPALSNDEAGRMRVRVGPDGMGAARPQAGAGQALRGQKQPAVAKAAPKDAEVAPKPKSAKRGHKKPPTMLGATTPKIGNNGAGRVDDKTKTTQVAEKPRTRSQKIEDAQQALLQADLRNAVDSFTRAAKDAPLDYDQLNWLGLAHYLNGELDEAEKTWNDARAKDVSRADAVNNLASAAKRRGDLVAEKKFLDDALSLRADDCHATNSLALYLAKNGKFDDADSMLTTSDANCGGNYPYTEIQRAGIKALHGDVDGAFKALELGLQRLDRMLPVKEFEVLSDLRLDASFAKLRGDSRFDKLVGQYLPRAVKMAASGQLGDAVSTDGSDGEEDEGEGG